MFVRPPIAFLLLAVLLYAVTVLVALDTVAPGWDMAPAPANAAAWVEALSAL